MTKTLVKHGNSYALIIDKPILDLLKITPETPLELSTNGRALTIEPLGEAVGAAELEEALQHVNKRHGKLLKRLAE